MEKAIFGKARCDFSKLRSFGFAESAAGYTYSAKIMDGEFCAEVRISLNGEVAGRLYDTAFHEEYTGLPYSFTGSEGKTEKAFRMKLIKKYRQDAFPISLLREHGITWIRGPRRLPDSLVKEIQRRETDGN